MHTIREKVKMPLVLIYTDCKCYWLMSVFLAAHATTGLAN